MSETTATHDIAFELTPEEQEIVEMYKRALVPTGWLCPRCGAVNAPDVKRCDCEPDAVRLPNTIVGPSETK